MTTLGLGDLSRVDLLSIMDVCQESLYCDSRAALNQLLLKVTTLLPSSATLAARVSTPGSEASAGDELINLSYPPGWLEEYVGRNYFSIDPIKKTLISGIGAMVCNWSECFNDEADYAARDFLNQLRGVDLASGITICLKRPSDSTMIFFSFAGDELVREQRYAHVLRYILPYLHEAFMRLPGLPPKKEPEAVTLTPREKDVLSWAMYGKTNVDIADLLNISERTAKFHVQNILGKLNACSRAHAVTIALQRGLLNA